MPHIGEKTELPSPVVSDLNFLWKRSTEHQRLSSASWRHGILLHNAPDLRLKAHVQHAIGLIQHQITAPGQQ